MQGFRRRGAGEPDAPALIRLAIVRIADQRAELTANAASAMVNQAAVDRALRQQATQLARARAEIVVALSVTRAAGRNASAAGDPAVAQYDEAAAGLRGQLDVLDAALGQLEALRGAGAGNVNRARSVLRETLRHLDETLRSELRLLVEAERVERARAIEAARARYARPEPPG